MGRKRKGRPITGWLVIDKGPDITSTQVVGRVKHMLQAQKVGHAGTLDPLATGVLPIALGEATKTVPYVMAAEKQYRFTVRFGEARSTDDAEGDVLESSPSRPSTAEIAERLPEFLGRIQQRPPAYAAVKVEGRRAYDLAREGNPQDLPEREVRIDRFELIDRPDDDHAIFEVTCGKGTYVRSLARDLGAVLGCFGHVTALRRTVVGQFNLDNAVSLESLSQMVQEDTLPQVFLSVVTALADIPALAVTEPQAHRLRSGQTITITPQSVRGTVLDGDTIKVVREGELVALGRLDGAELAPMRVFTAQNDARAVGRKTIDVDYS